MATTAATLDHPSAVLLPPVSAPASPCAEVPTRTRRGGRTARRTAGDGHPAADRRVLERIAAGDAAALDQVMARYAALVTAAARRVLGNSAEIEDVKQETWMSLCAKVGTIRQPECLGAWLWTTSTNHALRVARRRSRDVLSDPAALAFGAAPTEGDIADGLCEGEARVALGQALASLTALERQLIGLLFLSPPRPYAEVAELAGRPVGSLGPTRRRILEKLRRHPAIVALGMPLRASVIELCASLPGPDTAGLDDAVQVPLAGGPLEDVDLGVAVLAAVS